ncbi:hypothetical protein A3I51_00470 [Candidatus Gottesmanbacteria bacterium RIFCSPLOWO2_02_FULL_38_8]|uniref:Polymerase nucleotidyl transferase domain-containing protein n=1 Tax=Candidatus Gottesmanbacteria bacterium RIFCSPLOWO2_02_FULL_38_8 TaxID=1798397 RepID=A0A1F6B2K4_9BACT|nr:MAG: hypothetical protein A3I51_00470 [Candidatus Gottesmanbacteria bacterium RIFCSPLOWO2_02_FULL_38_8]
MRMAVVKTLAYADIFDYPLTLTEINKYLIGFSLKGKKTHRSLITNIKKIPQIKESDGYYFFSGREKIVRERKRKLIESRKKMRIARRIARLLFYLPTIKMIAVTGNLALYNADISDDIDFLIVTQSNRIWLTRFLCVVLLKLLGVNRTPNTPTVSDKICLNMFIDENNLTLPRTEQDLYSAHEIIQAKPILEKAGYKNILQRSNPWVKKFLPNALVIPSESRYASGEVEGSPRLYRGNLTSVFFNFLEYCANKFQLFYMRSRRTTEVIRDGFLRFHPHDARKRILKSYKNNLNKYRFL